MKTLYTLGPWRADCNGDGTHCITSGGGCDVADTRSSIDEEGNARLIAAAPELLRLLKLAVGGSDGSKLLVGKALADARAAIAKVEGK